MDDYKIEQRATLDRFRHWLVIPTRVNDNDFNNHVNNSIYYSYFDTLIVSYLIEYGGLHLGAGVLPFCVENRCRFYHPLSFPEKIRSGLCVTKIGTSSVRYEIGLFSENKTELSAQGYFIHVFVDVNSKKKASIPSQIRDALEKIRIIEEI